MGGRGGSTKGRESSGTKKKDRVPRKRCNSRTEDIVKTGRERGFLTGGIKGEGRRWSILGGGLRR